jgi:hypothetical protein
VEPSEQRVLRREGRGPREGLGPPPRRAGGGRDVRERQPAPGVVPVVRDQALVPREGGGGVPRGEVEGGQRLAGGEVGGAQLEDAQEPRARGRAVALGAVELGQVEERRLVGGVQRQRRLELRAGLRGAAEAPVGVPELRAEADRVGEARHGPLEGRDHARVLAAVLEADRGVVVGEDVHVVDGVHGGALAGRGVAALGVAEAREPAREVGVAARAGRRARAQLRGEGRQLAPQALHDLRPLRRQVARLAGVVLEVVELGARAVDQLPTARDQAAQRAPAEVQRGVLALDPDRALLAHAAAQERREARARDPLRRRPAVELEHGREQVRLLDQVIDHDAPREHPGQRDEQRDALRPVVDQRGVGRLALLAQGLAVVGDHDDQGPRVEAPRLQPREQPPDLGVDVSQLAVVGIGQGEVRRGRVLGVRVVEVDPEEVGRLGGLREPGDGGVDDGVGGAVEGAGAVRLEAVVVDLEAAVEPEAAVEGRRADEGPGAVPARGEELGHRGQLRAERGAAVVVQAVLGGQGARQQAGVGREGERDVGVGALEARAARRQAVEVRRARVGVAVAPQAVGAGRVQGHQQEARVRREQGLGLRRARRAGDQAEEQQGEEGTRAHAGEGSRSAGDFPPRPPRGARPGPYPLASARAQGAEP